MSDKKGAGGDKSAAKNTAGDSSGGDVSALADVKQYGLIEGVKSLGYVFWILGAMEMVERLAFYGVKAVAPDYADDPISKGGLGVGADQIGTIMLVWAIVQSIVPALTGGLSDRYGYKETIFASTVIKIGGYLIMALFPSYTGFMAGAMVLALGTAIFKPGIQGTLVLTTNRRNSSLAWGIFYQTVNIGGWLGPLVAARFRRMAWRNVFFANAAIICINFLLLLTYKEVGKEARLERARKRKEEGVQQASLWRESLRELGKPHVWRYLLVFAGFWFMFFSLFEVLVLYIKHWVDTRAIVDGLFGAGGTRSGIWKMLLGMNEAGTQIQPAGLLNLNAFSIMLTCVLFAQLSSKMRATTSIVVGALFATGSMFIFSTTPYAWAVAGGILLFSVGEMLSSPKFNEFMGNFAPADKKAMYLGFSQLPIAVGWGVEAKLGFGLYAKFSSKGKFARQYLAERGVAKDDIKKIEKGAAFDHAVVRDNPDTRQPYEKLTKAGKILGLLAKAARGKDDKTAKALSALGISDLSEKGIAAAKASTKADVKAAKSALDKAGWTEKSWQLARKLFAKHKPSVVWYIMGAVGILSAVGLGWYGRWVRKITEKRPENQPQTASAAAEAKGDEAASGEGADKSDDKREDVKSDAADDVKGETKDERGDE